MKKTPVSLSSLSLFLGNKSYYLPLRIFTVLLAISFFVLGITFKKLPPLVPLYYSLPWGEEQLTKSYELFIIPISLIIIFFINAFVSIFLIKKDTFLIQLLIWSSCFTALIGLITLTKIIFLVL